MEDLLSQDVTLGAGYILNPDKPSWLALEVHTDEWHGLAYCQPGLEETLGFFWSQKRTEFDEWAQKLDLESSDGWILSRWQAKGGETIYGPKPHIETRDGFVQVACGLILQEHIAWRDYPLVQVTEFQGRKLKLADALQELL